MTTDSPTRACPGCGLVLPLSDCSPNPRYHTSPECWQLYGELSAYTVTRVVGGFIHQLAVDAYAAQHAGEQSLPIGVAFALIGLYLTCEKGYSGAQVQHMHMLLARRSKTWPRFTSPSTRGDLTVRDVLQAPPGEQRDEMLRRWGRSIWNAWSQQHARVKDLFEQVMAD